jgi:hypothetical protein
MCVFVCVYVCVYKHSTYLTLCQVCRQFIFVALGIT